MHALICRQRIATVRASCFDRMITNPRFSGIASNRNSQNSLMMSFDMFGGLFQKRNFNSDSSQNSPVRIQSVAITGATGLLGTELVKSLESKNIKVYRITTRKSTRENDIFWNPIENTISNPDVLETVDAVINLAGENVASGEGALAFTGRWTDSKMKKVIDSRVFGTKLLVDTFKTLKSKPKIFLSASAVGYYGFTDSSQIFDETSKKGEGFLAEVSDRWEQEALKAESIGVASTCLRFSVILSPAGGVVGKLFPLFNLFLGGIIGSGQQGFSWVTINDAVRAIEFVLLEKSSALKGVVNVAAPEPCTNEDFTKAFGSALKRPTLFPLPEFAAKLVFGQMGEEMLLGGQKVVPSRLTKAGFKFDSEDIQSAMVKILQK